ncbi:hypothetical protein AB0C12_18025 [Actinoplanes sp. NPDC048967]|uniref:hypothetical protein n=1 Tax=Actinoplanes sp. NPDC048967 TaxID=3155269 RepID=UPI0033E2681B
MSKIASASQATTAGGSAWRPAKARSRRLATRAQIRTAACSDSRLRPARISFAPTAR